MELTYLALSVVLNGNRSYRARCSSNRCTAKRTVRGCYQGDYERLKSR